VAAVKIILRIGINEANLWREAKTRSGETETGRQRDSETGYL
jgi:hypothetical protein